MGPHAHESAQLSLVLAGAVQNTVDRRTEIVRESTLSFLPAEREHSTHYLSPVSACYIAISKEKLEQLGVFSSVLSLAATTFYAGPILQIAKAAHAELLEWDTASGLMIDGLVLQLIAGLARLPLRTEFAKTPTWVARAREMIHANSGRSLSISELAGEVGIHPVHLMRVFKQNYGASIGAYARSIRCQRAQSRLRCLREDESLAGLAFELGFKDLSHFCRAFKTETGMTPSEFRRVTSQERCKRPTE